MRRFTLLLLVALLGGTDRLAAQETVETRGIRSEVKIEEVIFGHLTELNGKFKLRATELTFAPDGYVGVHHHVGPEFDIFFPARLHLLREARRRSIKQATIFLKQGTSHTPRRIGQTCRLAC